MLSTAKVGDTVTLTIVRGGKSQDIKVTLGARPDDSSSSDSGSSGSGSGSQQQSPNEQQVVPPGFGQ